MSSFLSFEAILFQSWKCFHHPARQKNTVQLISAGRLVCTDLSEPPRGGGWKKRRKKTVWQPIITFHPELKGPDAKTWCLFCRLLARQPASDCMPDQIYSYWLSTPAPDSSCVSEVSWGNLVSVIFQSCLRSNKTSVLVEVCKQRVKMLPGNLQRVFPFFFSFPWIFKFSFLLQRKSQFPFLLFLMK